MRRVTEGVGEVYSSMMEIKEPTQLNGDERENELLVAIEDPCPHAVGMLQESCFNQKDKRVVARPAGLFAFEG